MLGGTLSGFWVSICYYLVEGFWTFSVPCQFSLPFSLSFHDLVDAAKTAVANANTKSLQVMSTHWHFNTPGPDQQIARSHLTISLVAKETPPLLPLRIETWRNEKQTPRSRVHWEGWRLCDFPSSFSFRSFSNGREWICISLCWYVSALLANVCWHLLFKNSSAAVFHPTCF